MGPVLNVAVTSVRKLVVLAVALGDEQIAVEGPLVGLERNGNAVALVAGVKRGPDAVAEADVLVEAVLEAVADLA
jgi:hypothetical protein